ncbi:wall-associated receptor kinase-like 8 isoform X2 [Triticum aestivum]|uniref:wall-associated receptor kinase-like 8 isoform X2 n=1 Tax=Triticum aestivum TaxID=4565 RepID=UPI001D02C731|nr:wall-associated receptor kinase-like 8 isoform X2 [Triticum aestivum]
MSQAKLILATVTALQLLMATAVAAVQVALPGCPQACGNVTVPYPFGFRRGCFRKGFNLTCDETRHPPKLLLGDGVEVDAISLADGTVHVQTKVVAFRPLYTNGAVGARRSIDYNYSWYGGLPEVYKSGAQLAVSTEHNVFVAIGCNFIGYLVAVSDGGREYVSTCSTLCNGKTRDALCTGVGCCWTTIAQRYPGYQVMFKDLDDTVTAYTGQSRASVAAFIVDREWFVGTMQNTVSFNDFVNDDFGNGPSSMPTVLQWWLDVDSDRDLVVKDPRSASRWRCISSNSFAAYIGDAVNKVRCNCSDGYEGNSYIVDGCQDIDECLRPDVYPCHGTCINMPGTYRCSAKKRIISLAGVAQVTKKLKKRRAKKTRQKFFKKNHGLLLQQLISSNKDIAEKMKIFSLEELEQATNKFDHNRILGGGGHGTVYKAILSDQRVVAIKKAKIVVQREIDQFINEVAILSQINHRNVVKLFGCCLETEVPLLVYEFISNGTLSCHLHGQSENHLSWKTRLRIALETARAIAYLHSAASISVYHRDIKCANILLTDTLTSKVSDFGASRSIAIDETGILTAVQGTHGYLDPEYYYTSRLTEKSDVYSFGVILAELLTRVTPVFHSHSSEVTSLASHFVSLIRDNRLLDILDTKIVEEGGAEDAEVVARLAEACLSLKGEERPTMRQVETTLEDVQNSTVNLSSQITRVNQNAINDQSYKGSKGGEGTRLYSLEKEFIQSSEIPR